MLLHLSSAAFTSISILLSYVAARYDPKLKPFYERIARKKGHQKAIVAVARKMLVSVYHVLTGNELYDGHREDVRIRKLKGLERKMIYQKWEIREIGFYWLIAELDRKKNTAFGYANLNNDDFAEWGYISMEELIDNGASPDKSWKPCTYEEAIRKIKGYEVK